MKKIILLNLFFISIISSAQKIDLDKEYISVNYLDLPKSTALNALQTYTVDLYADPGTLARMQFKDPEIENDVNLKGFQYTRDRSADILLEITIDRYEVISESIENTTYEVKGPDGKMVTRQAYFVATSSIAPTYIKLINNRTAKEVEYIGIATVNQPITYRSENFITRQDAIDFIQKSLTARRADHFNKTYRDLFHSTFANLQSNYCFTPKNSTDVLWEVDLKKSPEFSEFNEHLNKTAVVLKALTPTQPIESARIDLAPALKFWSENAAKVDATDKKMRKLKYGYLINLAVTQYWLEMYYDCEKTCNEIIANDYDAADGKRILANVTFTKKTLTANNVNTRHLERPGFNSTEIFRVAGNIKQLQRDPVAIAKEGPPKGFAILPGYIIDFENNRIDGELWVKDIDNSLCFSQSENRAVFVYDTYSGQQKMHINADNTNKLVLGRSAVFEAIKFKNKINGSEKYQFFRVYHENDKVKVLKYYDTPSNTKDQSIVGSFKMINGADICLMRKTDQVIELMGNLLPKKVAENSAKFYSDCPALGDKILSGEIKDMQLMTGQTKAADFYAESCK